MALLNYLSVEGATQGQITKGASTADSIGNVFQEGHEDESQVFSLLSGLTVPRDPNSGQPTGTRTHQPFTIRKLIDKASPLLAQAAATSERLQVKLHIFRTSATGQVEHFFSINLTDAIIVDMKFIVEDLNAPDAAKVPPLQEIALVYRKIEWTHEVGGTSGQDDWRAAR